MGTYFGVSKAFKYENMLIVFPHGALEVHAIYRQLHFTL
jgi:hypothetical protein